MRALAGGRDAAEPEEGPVAVLAADIGSLRAAVEFGMAAGDTEVVRRMTAALLLSACCSGVARTALGSCRPSAGLPLSC